MSYLVIARKWRPKTFDELVGQDHVVRTLKNAITSGRLAHAYLFCGARGVGKTTAARLYAKALNCKDGPTVTPCNECPECRAIMAGNSLNVPEIDGASNRGIDAIRELREAVRYLPSGARYKIYIVDEVHMLTAEAFNALLKTLEEPPPHVKFVFATTEPQKILGTILSRCQRFDFRRIPAGLIQKRLEEVLRAEKVKVDEKGLALIVRAAEGSMRDAQSLLDQVIAFGGQEIAEDAVREALGVISLELLAAIAAACLRGDRKACLDGVEGAYAAGHDMRQLADELLWYLRNLIVSRVSGAERVLENLPAAEAEGLAAVAGNRSLETLLRHFTVLSRAVDEIGRTTDPRILLEVTLLKMAGIEELEPVADLLARLQRMEKRLAAPGAEGKAAAPRGPAGPGGFDPRARGRPAERPPGQRSRPPAPAGPPRAAPAPPRRGPGAARPPAPAPPHRAPSPPPEPPPEPAAASFEGFVDWVKERRHGLGTALEHARLLHVDKERIDLGYSGDIFSEGLRDAANRRELADLAAQYFRRELKLAARAVRPAQDGDGPTLAEVREQRLKDDAEHLRKEAMSHPLVQEAIAIFGGEVASVGEPEEYLKVPGKPPDGSG